MRDKKIAEHLRVAAAWIQRNTNSGAYKDLVFEADRIDPPEPLSRKSVMYELIGKIQNLVDDLSYHVDDLPEDWDDR